MLIIVLTCRIYYFALFHWQHESNSQSRVCYNKQLPTLLQDIVLTSRISGILSSSKLQANGKRSLSLSLSLRACSPIKRACSPIKYRSHGVHLGACESKGDKKKKSLIDHLMAQILRSKINGEKTLKSCIINTKNRSQVNTLKRIKQLKPLIRTLIGTYHRRKI